MLEPKKLAPEGNEWNKLAKDYDYYIDYQCDIGFNSDDTTDRVGMIL